MSEGRTDEYGLVAEYKRMLARAPTEIVTGDSAIDALLGAIDPSTRNLVCDLSVPHWFDSTVISALSREITGTDLVLTRIAGFPFVRRHPRGYAYHDDVRLELRTAVLQQRPEHYRTIAKKVYEAVKEGEQHEEARRELIYLELSFDEDSAMHGLDVAIQDSRSAFQINVTDTLVQLAEEQRSLLSPEHSAMVDFYRGLLASDSRAWQEAATIFRSLDYQKLPPPIRARSRLHLGLCLERLGQLFAARDLYTQSLALPDESTPAVAARLHERLADAYLALGDLGESEANGRRSLEINRASGDEYGKGINLLTLGAIRSKLHDPKRAAELLEQSREVFERLGKRAEVSRVWNEIAAVALYAADWGKARLALDTAQGLNIELGDQYGLAFVYANQGKLKMAESSDAEQAVRYLEASLSLFRHFRDRMNAAKVLRNLALIFEIQKDLPKAEENMRRAYEAMPEESALKPLYASELQRLQRGP
jgi:tetratricopeptide (TPR) repeat protein